MDSVVQQERRTPPHEHGKFHAVNRFDLGDCLATEQRFQRSGIAEQAQIVIGLPGVGVVEQELPCDDEAGRDRFEAVAIGDAYTDALTQHTHKFAGIRCELERLKSDSRQRLFIERSGEGLAVKPWGTDNFEGRSGAAADRQIGRFEKTDTRVQECFGGAAHVRRWINPGKTGVIKMISATPAAHLNDTQIEIEMEFGLQHHGQFADSHAMANSNGVKANKRLSAIVKNGSGNVDTIDRVWPVENDKANIVFRSSDHGVAHRRDVSIETRADVLDVKHERVDIGEHCPGRSSYFSVETDDRNFCAGFGVVTDDGNIKLAREAMLRTEQAQEFNSLGCLQQLHGTAAVSGDSGMVAYQSNPGTGQLSKVILHQYIDARQHSVRLSVGQAGGQQESQQKTSYFHRQAQ
jgi:hypothetical protein